MKTPLIRLFVLMSLLVFLFSCKKDGDIDEGIITLKELNGSWNFVFCSYNDTVYDCSSTSRPANLDWMFFTMDFDRAGMTVQINSACNPGGVADMDFTKNTDLIKFGFLADKNFDAKYGFTVIAFDGPELHLKIEETPWPYDYLGAILVLEK